MENTKPHKQNHTKRHFYYIFFIIFYVVYLEILSLKIYFENCAKNKREEHQETEGVFFMKTIVCMFQNFEYQTIPFNLL